MKPAELLQYLGVAGIALEDALVGCFSAIILCAYMSVVLRSAVNGETYVLLLFVNMADLEQDVFLAQGGRR